MSMFDSCGDGLSDWDKDVQNEFTLDEEYSDDYIRSYIDDGGEPSELNSADSFFDGIDGFDEDYIRDYIDDGGEPAKLNSADSFFDGIEDKSDKSDYLIDVPADYFKGMTFDDFQTEEMALEKEIHNCSNSSSINVLKSNLESFRSSYYRSTIPF